MIKQTFQVETSKASAYFESILDNNNVQKNILNINLLNKGITISLKGMDEIREFLTLTSLINGKLKL